MLVAPCILYIRSKAETICLDQSIASQIAQLLRDVKMDWASEAIATCILPHVEPFLRHTHTQVLLNIAMCYSKTLFVEIYRQLCQMRASSVASLDRETKLGLYLLAHRLYQVAQYVPSMATNAYTILVSLYNLCTDPEK